MKYSNLFRLGLADVASAAKIRHEVYCQEHKFLPTSDDGMETDRYDNQSLHCMLSAPDNDPIGYVRLILPNINDKSNKLPFELACAEKLNPEIKDISPLVSAEASRLAVRKPYRFPGNDKSSPHILPALLMGCLATSALMDIRTLFFITEKRIADSFNRRGAGLEQVGEPVEYHGIRIPYKLDVHNVLPNLDEYMNELFVFAKKSLEAGLMGVAA